MLITNDYVHLKFDGRIRHNKQNKINKVKLGTK